MKRREKKSARKYVISVAAILMAIGVGMCAACSSNAPEEKGSELYTVESEEVIAGLEWGMTLEEAQQALENKENYTYIPEIETFICYDVSNYQGIEGANGLMILYFTEENVLESGVYKFDIEGGGYSQAISQDINVELNKAFRKSYKETSDKMYYNPEGDGTWTEYLYYKTEESLISINEMMPNQFVVKYRDVSRPMSQAIIEELSLN